MIIVLQPSGFFLCTSPTRTPSSSAWLHRLLAVICLPSRTGFPLSSALRQGRAARASVEPMCLSLGASEVATPRPRTDVDMATFFLSSGSMRALAARGQQRLGPVVPSPIRVFVFVFSFPSLLRLRVLSSCQSQCPSSPCLPSPRPSFILVVSGPVFLHLG
jgi:hypothetical protein